MWKYLKGTEKDFEKAPQECDVIVKPYYGHLIFYTKRFDKNLHLLNGLVWIRSMHKNYVSVEEVEGEIIAQREWIEESIVETKSEEQQPLPSTEDINVADAMEQSSTPHIGSMINPAKDLPKIKLDVKKPVFDKATDLEVKFIYSNRFKHVFELSNGEIATVNFQQLDDYFYNKPETKTTVEVLDSAWKRACNAGSLWASPTQLFYMAIEQLVKDGVVDMNKVYEVKQ